MMELGIWFQWLMRSTLQVSLLVFIVLAVKTVLRTKLAPRWHYCLWLLVVVRMLMPAAPQSSLSVFNLIGGPIERATPAPVAEIAPVAETGLDETLAVEAALVAQRPLQVETEQQTPQAAAPATEEGTTSFTIPQLGQVLPIIWFFGAIVLAIYVFAGNFRLWSIVKLKRPVTDSGVLDLLEDCKAQMNIHTPLAVVETDRIASPALFGFLRPRLLLPEGMLGAMNRSQLRHVLLHELAHLKRGDIYLGWLVAILQTVHWFNPVVWFGFHRMRSDRELACDNLALSAMGEEEPAEYGRTIVKLLENFSKPKYTPSLAGILEERSQLKRRISMIAKFKKSSYRISVGAIMLIAVLSVVSLTDGHTERDGERLSEKVSANLQDDLLVYYSFDRDSGTKTVDISGADFHGRVRGAEHVSEGKIGGAMRFNGKKDRIRIGQLKLSSFTFASWIKTQEIHSGLNNRRIFLLDDGKNYYAIQGNVNGGIGVYITGDLEVNEYDWRLARDKWAHIAVTFDGEQVKIFKDGDLTQTGEAAFDGTITGKAYIAYSGDTNKNNTHDGDFNWHGSIDETAIFNRALSTDEVKQLYKMTGYAGQTETLTSEKNDIAGNDLSMLSTGENTSAEAAYIAQKVLDRYANIETFSAVGEIVKDAKRNSGKSIMNILGDMFKGPLKSKEPLKSICTIKMAKPNRYCIEWNENYNSRHSSLNKIGYVWSLGKGSDQLQFGKNKHNERFSRGLLTAEYMTMQPSLFFDTSMNRFKELRGRSRLEDEQVEGVACYVITGKHLRRTYTYWVSKDDFLIRRCRSVSGGKIGEVIKEILRRHGNDITPEEIAKIKKQFTDGDEKASKRIITDTQTYRNFIIDKPIAKESFEPSKNIEDIRKKLENIPHRHDITGIKGVSSAHENRLQAYLGTWQGTAIDKPEDGSSEDHLQLHLSQRKNKLIGSISGKFARDNFSELRNLKVDGDTISFEVDHNIENLEMKVTLKLVDGMLRGEGVPINIIEDRCDIFLTKIPEVIPVRPIVMPVRTIRFDTTEDFLPGDSIEITEILGSTGKIETGRTYTIRGKYKLASQDKAKLFLYATNGETTCKQGPTISKGQGEFIRTFSYQEEGWLHLGLYSHPGNEGNFGNLYFNHKNGYVPDITKIKGMTSKRKHQTDPQVAKHSIPIEIDTTSDFLLGDSIEITEILGSTGRIEPGQTYTIKGKYKLSSRDEAQIHFLSTNGSTCCSPGPIIKRGRGEFTRTLKYTEGNKDTWLLSKFVQANGNESFGNLYFYNKNSYVPRIPEIRGGSSRSTVRRAVKADVDESAMVSAIQKISLTGDDVIKVKADGQAGFNFPFYLFIPKTVDKNKKVHLFVEPNNTGTSSDDLEVHREKALRSVRNNYPNKIARSLGSPLLVPTFPRPKSNWRAYTHALDRDTLEINDGKLKRIDLQLTAMIKYAQKLLRINGFKIEDQIFMHGFSASAKFANRYSYLHPEMVKAVAVGGVNGLPTLPVSKWNGYELPFPIGLAGIEKFTGKPFDGRCFRNVAHYIYMGAFDRNDTLPSRDAWSEKEAGIIKNALAEKMMPDRWELTQKIYKDHIINAQCVTYNGVSHSIKSEMMDDVVRFFKANSGGRYNPIEPHQYPFVEYKQIKQAHVNGLYWSNDERLAEKDRKNPYERTFLIGIEEWNEGQDHRQLGEFHGNAGFNFVLKAEGQKDIAINEKNFSGTRSWGNGEFQAFYVKLNNSQFGQIVSGVSYRLEALNSSDEYFWTVNDGVGLTKSKPTSKSSTKTRKTPAPRLATRGASPRRTPTTSRTPKPAATPRTPWWTREYRDQHQRPRSKSTIGRTPKPAPSPQQAAQNAMYLMEVLEKTFESVKDSVDEGNTETAIVILETQKPHIDILVTKLRGFELAEQLTVFTTQFMGVRDLLKQEKIEKAKAVLGALEVIGGELEDMVREEGEKFQ